MRLHNAEKFNYFIDEEKRTVVAVLTVPQNAMGNEMLRIMKKESGNHFAIDDCVINTSMLLKGKYVGKAVCHSEDEWNVEVGKRLAALRATKQYANDRYRINRLIVDIFDGIQKRFERAEDYAADAPENIEEEIEKIVESF
jgi:hypothetical protein